jgi:hypothetical protein
VVVSGGFPAYNLNNAGLLLTAGSGASSFLNDIWWLDLTTFAWTNV